MLTYRGRADQVVWVSLGRVGVMGHTAHHHHRRSLVTVHLVFQKKGLTLRKDVVFKFSKEIKKIYFSI